MKARREGEEREEEEEEGEERGEEEGERRDRRSLGVGVIYLSKRIFVEARQQRGRGGGFGVGIRRSIIEKGRRIF